MNRLQTDVSPIPITIFGLVGIPEIRSGDNLGKMILDAISRNGMEFRDRDVIVVTQKIVSKAENRFKRINDIVASRSADQLAKKLGRDPRYVQMILDESRRVIKAERGIIITETKHGLICANSGIDQSNLPAGVFTLLPEDPDASARKIRKSIMNKTGKDIAVIISDTFGRPLREGHIDIAIGISGMQPILDYAGKMDKFGNRITVTAMAIADELASSAELVRRKLDDIPVALIRGYSYNDGSGSAAELNMPNSKSLFK